MKRKNKRFHIGKLICFLLVLLTFCSVVAPWAMEYGNLRPLKNFINNILFNDFEQENYNAKSLILINCSNGDDVISKRSNEQLLPASLAKLFVIDYATTIIGLEDIVTVSCEAISLTKPDSSTANIDAKNYYVKNLYAAMLVPSGNDAAYALAGYCGGILSPQSQKGIERVSVFMDSLNKYLQENGYSHTVLYDPSGYDTEALTTVTDIKTVTNILLENQWFRDIVSQSTYTATLPDGSQQVWKNTNEFLDTSSDYYEKNVVGIKTGSLGDDYNLVVLYQQYGKEFLICSLGSQSNTARYDDVCYILRTIDQSDYVKH